MSDGELFQLCQQYGRAALEARRKFEGLLPEVFRRKLYEKKGFGSIFEFAAKLAGLSEEQVRRVLNLEKKFADKPALHSALVLGEVSSHKLAKVASIATKENDEALAEKTKVLSARALETLVRDEKSVHVNTHPQESLPEVNLLEYLSAEVQKDLIERLEKGIDVNALLKELLENHDKELEEEKDEIAVEEIKKKPSRYMSVKVRRVLKREHGDKCSIPWCGKRSEELHHTQRFALAGAHDPRYIAPLCKAHHEIAGAIDAKAWQKRWSG